MEEPRHRPRPEAMPARLLVVDDSAVVRRTVSALLEAEGFSVETASSGEQAFARCLSEGFDLVVSDVLMGSLSGMHLCRLLRSDEATEHTPIVLLTAEDDPRSRFWARHAGADAYVTKERMRTALASVVSEQLRARSLQPRPRQMACGAKPDPLARLANILERHLFRAVVAGEVRELVRHIEDPAAFARDVLAIAAQLASYDYLTLELHGPVVTTVAVHARGPFPAEPTAEALSALQIDAAAAADLELVRDGPSPTDDGAPTVEDSERFEIRAGRETLSELCVFGRTRLSEADRQTMSLIASELGVVVKSLFLFQETQRLADTDPLTGAANRRSGTERLAHELERARRSGRPFCVALCDLDHFKRINDEHGHGVGDEILRVTARELSSRTRSVDLVSRWGGEEFLVLITDANATGGRIVGKRLRIAVAQATREVLGDGVTMSVGVAVYERGMELDALVERADCAMYRAKEQGRDTLVVYEEA